MSQSYPMADLGERIVAKDIFFEFTKLVRRYLEAKELLKKGSFLDSLYRVHQSLHHSARLAVLEVGEEPDLLLWEQVKEIDSSVYKLYEELITSREALDKRIELFLLALEFSISSKLDHSVEFLLMLMKTRKEPWTINEIVNHPSINDPTVELAFILEKMVNRSLLKLKTRERQGILETGYSYFYF